MKRESLAVIASAAWFGTWMLLPGVAWALGEPIDGRPSHNERLAHYETNKARAEPATSSPHGWPDYPAQPPLLWADMLAKSSIAHSEDMRDTPCFQHPSCDGTDPFERIKMYWTVPFSTMGENIAAGDAYNDGQAVIQLAWIDEGGDPNMHGHRDNMFSKDFTHVGLGYAAGGTQFHGYWTQDFAGVSPRPEIPPLACGTHFFSKAGTGNTFGTVYYSEAGTKPDHVDVVVDGKASELSLVKGEAAAGAYETDITLMAGCHRYYFSVTVGGKESTYPDTGTLGVDPMGGKCPDFVAGPVGGTANGGGTNMVGGGGNGGGGCSVGAVRNPDASAWVTLLGLSGIALVLRRIARRRGRA